MKISEILRAHPGFHKGYALQTIFRTRLTKHDMAMLSVRKMKKIPGKISAYLYRDRIDSIWKSYAYGNNSIDNPYYILSTDGTIFEVFY